MRKSATARSGPNYISVAGLGAAATPGSLAGAGTANASEVGFIQSLNNNGISVCDANLALSVGFAMCSTLNDYNGVPVAETFYQITDYSVPDRYTAAV